MDHHGARARPTAIIEERRPVELLNLYMVGERSAEKLHLLPTLVDGRPNPWRCDSTRNPSGPARVRSGAHGGRRRLSTPRRLEVVERLEAESDAAGDLLHLQPRRVATEAAEQCLDCAASGSRRPSSETASARSSTSACRRIDDGDLDVLGYDKLLAGLEAGVAAHHAGMVPPIKEAVEACFAEGLVKVVFATETLRSASTCRRARVVIEKLSKFTGEHHEFLTPGEYTQLTGRAGRRGIDTVGLRGRALVALRALRPGRRARVEPIVRAHVGVSSDVQHGGQPRAVAIPRSRRTTC